MPSSGKVGETGLRKEDTGATWQVRWQRDTDPS